MLTSICTIGSRLRGNDRGRKLLPLLLLLTTNTYAWMCPSGFNIINPGDTLDQVKAKCGKPPFEKKISQPADVPQEWGYYVPVNPPNPATIKMSVVFTQGKVVNITINAMSLVSSSVCGPTISVGDSMEAVKTACKAPMFINKGTPQPGQAPAAEITQIKYNTSSPPDTLIFVNGILQERK